MLASIFGVQNFDNSSPVISIAGVQTRAGVQQAILNSGIGSGAPQFISQQLQNGANQLHDIKNRIAFIDVSGNAEPMPDFKPNTQKGKSFLKRLELGSNIQFSNPNRLLPTTGDFAFSLGYKLNDKSVVGIGAAYKLGIGSIERIRFTNQGLGIRTYADWKIKGNFFISGGYERNYLQSMPVLISGQNLSSWQESGLIGINKKVSVAKNKKITFQVVFDFLSYKNIPHSPPVLFRTGWTF